ncbi:MAG TPA: hypothetical protein VGQ76_10760 [Thermoanaerobaculia bacterium]|jgi:hypothetical protein|nr:hypothetical protein [Thermoanaerobaculia bacterium]
MNLRITFLFIFLSIALRLDAGMVRVHSVIDGQTLVVERGGIASTVQLAGLTITDDDGARALMEWTLVNAWVMLDEQPGGGHFLYRSPDALFVNRELVMRGFARATLPSIEPTQHVVVTFLGTTNSAADFAAKRRSDALLDGATKTKSRAAAGNGSGAKRSARPKPSRSRQPRKP